MIKALSCAGLLFLSEWVLAEAIPVELIKTEAGWSLLRDGEPYFIKGAGGDASLERLAAAGANSVRTWSVDGAEEVLDAAHALGLTVTLGVWLGHERHGFDYSDAGQVSAQLETVREAVLKYRDHPALLLWGIGNEMEGYETGDDPRIWTAVNDIAAMVKQLDPHHPTMTVTADIGGGRVQSIHQDSPAIDIHGVNSYGGAASIAERLLKAGGQKPFVLTEFGPFGPWEMPTTDWGAPFEPTSTEKAQMYRQSYEQGILEASGQALGSYVFLWGNKMESTATWFGMMLDDGSKLAAEDVMTTLWSGRPPDDLSPAIEAISVDGDTTVDPGSIVKVQAPAIDPEGGKLRYRWVLRSASSDIMTGGDYRPPQADIAGAVVSSQDAAAVIRMPPEPGAYRVFAYVYDAAGNVATANVPLLVRGEPRPNLPLSVYEETLEWMPWVPSGWMGNTKSLSLDGEYANNAYQGEHAIRIRYDDRYRWAGVAWQHPANNWGDEEGGFDLSGATALEVWARGEYGGEVVTFGVGLLGRDRDHPDSAIVKTNSIALSSEWTLYHVPLRGKDLSSLKTGFVITLEGRRSAVTVYLDSIRFIR